jgi:hypothetical protein
MNDLIVKRPLGRPRGTTAGINERLERYRISERCAEFTDEVLDFCVEMMRNEPVPVASIVTPPMAFQAHSRRNGAFQPTCNFSSDRVPQRQLWYCCSITGQI